MDIVVDEWKGNNLRYIHFITLKFKNYTTLNEGQ